MDEKPDVELEGTGPPAAAPAPGVALTGLTAKVLDVTGRVCAANQRLSTTGVVR